MNKITYLTVSDVENYKCTLNDVMRLSPMFTEDNYMTYYIYLQCRPDLDAEERSYYESVMKELIECERNLLKTFVNK
jgi:hypothetical protein